MRVVLWLVVVAGAVAPRQSLAQSAYDYPICSFYEGSEATSCYYKTYEQCMATVSGIGGYCFPNPAYRSRPVAEPPRRRGQRN